MNSIAVFLNILVVAEPLVTYHGRQLLYLPEVVILILLVLILATGRFRKLLEGWRRLPYAVQVGIVLILIGGGIAASIASSPTTGLGALKSWFIFPMASFLIFISFPAAVRYVRYGVTGVIALEVMYGLWQLLSQGELSRMTGTFESANFLAMLLAPALVMAVVEAIQSKDARWWGVAVFFLIGLVLTGSVGGVLGIVIVGGLFLFRSSLSVVQRAVLTMVLVAGLVVGAVGIKSRLNGGEQNSVNSRVQIWHTSLYLGSRQPLTGIGVGNFSKLYADSVVKITGRPPVDWSVSLPHNIFLAFWLYSGLLGLIGLILLLVEALQPKYGIYFLPFLVLFGHGLVDTPYFLTHAVYIFWLLFGLGLLSAWQDKNKTRAGVS